MREGPAGDIPDRALRCSVSGQLAGLEPSDAATWLMPVLSGVVEALVASGGGGVVSGLFGSSFG